MAIEKKSEEKVQKAGKAVKRIRKAKAKRPARIANRGLRIVASEHH